jgi:hypothetical protein
MVFHSALSSGGVGGVADAGEGGTGFGLPVGGAGLVGFGGVVIP